jgi:hypothetical protein
MKPSRFLETSKVVMPKPSRFLGNLKGFEFLKEDTEETFEVFGNLQMRF